MPKSKAQVKKEQPKTEPTNTKHIVWIIGIVAVVAIIAIVFVNTRPQPLGTDQTTNEDETAFAGQAVRTGQIVQPRCFPCPAELKYYEMKAYIASAPSPENSFELYYSINGEENILSQPTGYRYVSPISGARVTLHADSLFQPFAGGTRMFALDIERACAKGYQIRATDLTQSYGAPITLNNEWGFWSDGEYFNLSIGESHTLADGTKFILRNILQQDYAGGMYGIDFDMLCRSRLN